MNLLIILAAVATVLRVGTTTYAGCATSTCRTDEKPTTTQQAVDATLERRIENALRDLEISNARALATRIDDALNDLESATARTLKADQERLNALVRKSGIYR
jgi:hypothetical protein